MSRLRRPTLYPIELRGQIDTYFITPKRQTSQAHRCDFTAAEQYPHQLYGPSQVQFSQFLVSGAISSKSTLLSRFKSQPAQFQLSQSQSLVIHSYNNILRSFISVRQSRLISLSSQGCSASPHWFGRVSGSG